MHYTEITGNGTYAIALNDVTHSKESTVHVEAAAGAASVSIGWEDTAGNFNAYENGVIAAGESKRVRHGQGVKLAAEVSGFNTNFSIGYAD